MGYSITRTVPRDKDQEEVDLVLKEEKRWIIGIDLFEPADSGGPGFCVAD